MKMGSVVSAHVRGDGSRAASASSREPAKSVGWTSGNTGVGVFAYFCVHKEWFPSRERANGCFEAWRPWCVCKTRDGSKVQKSSSLNVLVKVLKVLCITRYMKIEDLNGLH